MSAYDADLLDLIAEADPAIACGCDVDEPGDLHDTITCRCGHRIVDHRQRTALIGCQVDGCHCDRLVKRPHRGDVPTAASELGWDRELKLLLRRMDGAA